MYVTRFGYGTVLYVNAIVYTNVYDMEHAIPVCSSSPFAGLIVVDSEQHQFLVVESERL